jgi:fructuronate reductase
MNDIRWLHFGAGNIFRAFIAALYDKIAVAESHDTEIIHRIYEPCDNKSLIVTLRADGGFDTREVGVIEAIDARLDGLRLCEIFRSEALQLVTFTITEKGYNKNAGGVCELLAKLVFERWQSCKKPLALLSCDNCSRNGDILKENVMHFAGAYGEGFLNYVNASVSFPCSMIDKITPRPSQEVAAKLNAVGFKNTEIIFTDKNTCIAPFVNAEQAQYLVIEDDFPNGRPEASAPGLYFTTRATVEKAERMKVTACLNPLHTALAVFGCLLGYSKISEEMKDGDLRRLVEKIGYDEGLPVVDDPGIFSPEDFLKEVLEQRLPNPFVPDTPQRIACDTSQKIPIRFGETIKAYGENAKDLIGIPLAIAAWLKYFDGVDDFGNAFELSPDPRLEELKKTDRAEILRDKTVFGSDLFELGLGEKILSLYSEMNAGPGAVRAVLKANV